ncbi:MAG: ferredoxin [Thermobacillus sp.]|jgi:2Fe-2S ferredoxin|uniref:Ferredoxin n=2 Tax=Thermobacillus TaxID=76632 RepID=L0EFR7_THECK|nr:MULTISPECIES: 2Fe-2S iron-sulfur cluster-binding protein [Thermobacillus]AGA57995.1 ferredoxin [Thermobacillus composti KWC4]REJ13182.1 MAG: ferredoxin [Paenibacillaceae bacterium]REK59186.1 MAG: ferredoxin [Thermobacillus sp.]CAG5088069.1 Ferredoxin [Thermobacillus xylanilyticus]
MIYLRGRTKEASVPAEAGLSLLEHALKAGVDWGFSCTRGTCARCRCRVEAGAEWLEDITDAEWDRLEPEEFDEGYRLACQAVVRAGAGEIRVVNRPYF